MINEIKIALSGESDMKDLEKNKENPMYVYVKFLTVFTYVKRFEKV